MNLSKIAALSILTAFITSYTYAGDNGCAQQKHYTYINAGTGADGDAVAPGGQTIYQGNKFHLYACLKDKNDEYFWCGYNNSCYLNDDYKPADQGCAKTHQTRGLMEFPDADHNKTPYELIEDYHKFSNQVDTCNDAVGGTSDDDVTDYKFDQEAGDAIYYDYLYPYN